MCSCFKRWKSCSRLNSSTVNGTGGSGGRGFLKLGCWSSSFAISPASLSASGVSSSAVGVSSTSVGPVCVSSTPVTVFNAGVGTTACGASSSSASASPASVSPADMSASNPLGEATVATDIVVSVVSSIISLYCILILCTAAISNKVKRVTIALSSSIQNQEIEADTLAYKHFHNNRRKNLQGLIYTANIRK
uniref:Uncharacterized protein n=1 Tax=Glossina pallidipes TaxID=7398 RepID=A0A1A9ZH37_GLOPL